MQIEPNFKSKIHQYLCNSIDEKIELLNSSLQKLKESRNQESKSSMGDKYETSREIIQKEMDNNEEMLQRLNKQKALLISIGSSSNYTKVEQGALLSTNSGLYYFLIGIGQVEIDNINVFVISANSPIGMLLLDKKTGDKIKFQEKEIHILDIA